MDLTGDLGLVFKLKKYLFLLGFSGLFLDAKVCELQIKNVQHTSEEFTLTLVHNANCEVIMDESRYKIVLIPKVHESNSTVSKDTIVPAVGAIDKLISLAKSKMGDSYEPAKAGPDHFDCSGFVYYVFKTNGIQIPRSSLLQSQSGDKLSRDQIRRGDILFFDTHERKHINHSGIYLGEGKFIHSSSGKAYGVTVSELDKGFYKDKFRWGVRKIKE